MGTDCAYKADGEVACSSGAWNQSTSRQLVDVAIQMNALPRCISVLDIFS